MITTQLAEKIHSQINNSTKIMLVAHQNADGDALGALCAMYVYLKDLEKQVFIYSPEAVINKYQFLPYIEHVNSDIEAAKAFDPDLIIVLDTGDLRHAGLADHLEDFSKPKIINIDHHPTNENYGHINLVRTQAVSTSEIILQFFKIIKFQITKEVATCLLTGIIFDSNNFTNPNTTLSSLQATAELLKLGARMPQVNDNFIRNKSLETLQLWGDVLSRLKYDEEYGTATTVVTKKDLKKYNLEPEAYDGISNFLNNLGGVKASILLKEEEGGIIRGSMRTNSDNVDLSELAKTLGAGGKGGGHRKAAGFTVKGKLRETDTGWEVV
ncbi:bifunctional oligoribonuclease/PAP phosphatase NrnA [Patescibacteria group bacterium]|nr:bifunctional oligoribonuclease/PAP phosphatase NrnA [Patescibacteria group bacterium]